MKRKILPALLLCAAMLTPALPTEALVEGAPISLSIRPMNGPTAGADGAVHVSAEEAEAGKTMHFGVFIESDHFQSFLRLFGNIGENTLGHIVPLIPERNDSTHGLDPVKTGSVEHGRDITFFLQIGYIYN